MGRHSFRWTIDDSADSAQAWWEATTKGAILILASSEAQRSSRNQFNLSPAVSATVGGVAGGAAQAYLVMGMTTCMKTIEVTRSKTAAAGERIPGTMEVFANILRTQGIRGINKGMLEGHAPQPLAHTIYRGQCCGSSSGKRVGFKNGVSSPKTSALRYYSFLTSKLQHCQLH